MGVLTLPQASGNATGLHCDTHVCRRPISRRWHARQSCTSATRQQHSKPCCDARPGASEPSRDPLLPPDQPRAKAPASWNPFKNTKKEDAARAALQDMFKDKGDLLAVYDDAPGGGGKGKGRSGGGGGGGGRGQGGGNWFGGFSFNPSSWGRTLLSLFKRVGSTLGAVLLFIVAVSAISLWKPLLNSFTSLIRYVLRLGGPGARKANQTPSPQLAGSTNASGLGPYEQSVIDKYGADDYFAPDSGNEEDAE